MPKLKIYKTGTSLNEALTRLLGMPLHIRYADVIMFATSKKDASQQYATALKAAPMPVSNISAAQGNSADAVQEAFGTQPGVYVMPDMVRVGSAIVQVRAGQEPQLVGRFAVKGQRYGVNLLKVVPPSE